MPEDKPVEVAEAPAAVIESEGDEPKTDEEKEFDDEFENGEDPTNESDDAPVEVAEGEAVDGDAGKQVAEGDKAKKPVEKPAEAAAVEPEKPNPAEEPETAAERLERRAKEADSVLPPLDEKAEAEVEKGGPKPQSDREKELEAELATANAATAKAEADLWTATGEPLDLSKVPKTEDLLRRLPDGEAKTRIVRFLADYPESAETTAILATLIAGQNKSVEGGATAEQVAELKKQYDALQVVAGRQEHERKIINGSTDKDGNFVKGHADMAQVIHATEFVEWAKTQSELVKKIIDGVTGDWHDCICVIDAYKETVAKASKKTNADTNTKKLDGQQKLNGASLRTGTPPSGGAGGKEPKFKDADAEFEDEWENGEDPKE